MRFISLFTFFFAIAHSAGLAANDTVPAYMRQSTQLSMHLSATNISISDRNEMLVMEIIDQLPSLLKKNSPEDLLQKLLKLDALELFDTSPTYAGSRKMNHAYNRFSFESTDRLLHSYFKNLKLKMHKKSQDPSVDTSYLIHSWEEIRTTKSLFYVFMLSSPLYLQRFPQPEVRQYFAKSVKQMLSSFESMDATSKNLLVYLMVHNIDSGVFSFKRDRELLNLFIEQIISDPEHIQIFVDTLNYRNNPDSLKRFFYSFSKTDYNYIMKKLEQKITYYNQMNLGPKYNDLSFVLEARMTSLNAGRHIFSRASNYCAKHLIGFNSHHTLSP